MLASACSQFEEFEPEFDVYVLLPAEGLGDRSFADRVYEGTEFAISNSTARVSYIIPESFDDAQNWIRDIPNLQTYTSKPALIIIAGAQFGSTIEEMNAQFDPHKVVFFGQSDVAHSSLAVLDFRTYAPSYIGGYLSAQLKPGARSVIIAGMDVDFLRDYEKGFTQGVIDAGGIIDDPVYLSTSLTGFEMPDSAYIITTALLDQYDLVFALSAGSNFGIINACRDYPEQRYAVGIDADQSWMGKTVVTGSVTKDFGTILQQYIDDFSKGLFNDGNFMENYDSGSTDFLTNPHLLNEKSKTQELINIAIEKERNN